MVKDGMFSLATIKKQRRIRVQRSQRYCIGGVQTTASFWKNGWRRPRKFCFPSFVVCAPKTSGKEAQGGRAPSVHTYRTTVQYLRLVAAAAVHG